MTPEEKIEKAEQRIRAEKQKIAEAKKEANQIRRDAENDKDPTVEYMQDEPPAKSIKEIDVIIDGKTDFNDGKFDGNIKVEGNEFEGDLVGYSSGIVESESEEQKFIYSITALCTNSDGTSPKGVMSYEVQISNDMREILVYVYRYDNDEPIIIYGKVE